MAGTGYNYKKKIQKSSDNENLSELKARIKDKAPSGVYIFRGEEEYMKRFYFSELTKSAGDSGANVTVIDEDDFSLEMLLDAVNTAPAIDYTDSFFSDEADINTNSSVVRVIKCECAAADKLSEKEKNALSEQFTRFPDGVCAVFYYPYNQKKEKDYAKSIKLLSGFDNVLDVEFCHESPTSPLLKKWVKRHFDAKKCPIDAAGIDYIINAVGCDMSTLSGEIDKLCSYLSLRDEKTVYISDIDYVCIRNTEARLDDVSRGALEGDYGKAISALSILISEKVSETYIFGAISNKINELCTVDYYRSAGLTAQEICTKAGLRDFVVRGDIRMLENIYRDNRGKSGNPCDRYVKILSEYDIKIKSSAGDKYTLLRNMVFKLCKGK